MSEIHLNSFFIVSFKKRIIIVNLDNIFHWALILFTVHCAVQIDFSRLNMYILQSDKQSKQIGRKRMQ